MIKILFILLFYILIVILVAIAGLSAHNDRDELIPYNIYKTTRNFIIGQRRSFMYELGNKIYNRYGPISNSCIKLVEEVDTGRVTMVFRYRDIFVAFMSDSIYCYTYEDNTEFIYNHIDKLYKSLKDITDNIDEDIIHDIAYAKYLFMWR